ncbi:MAG: DUF721 domain-containing protein [Crocinitomicaceae bacterium]|nr:DUF721 domain-containing protein [Crocinitomicaceae bacterium]MBT5402545.1 DUF721 domain-containing protein [Crocinitomicaceae bacterium]MBT6514230.1 DUF721 domain-containing protein [Crocinitomicaceae bacterium]
MAKRKSNTSSLDEAIKSLLKAYRLNDKMVELDIVKGWPEIMGPVVAAKTISIKVNKKVLVVELNSSVLREELSYGKAQIVKNVNDFLQQDFLEDVRLK